MISVRYIVEGVSYTGKALRVPNVGEIVVFNAESDEQWAITVASVVHCYGADSDVPYIEAHCERTDCPVRSAYIEVA
jgi:hypothetical protein